jgi:hypothetical protein
MSTSLLVAKERQPGSPFGLGQKQAKNLWRKRATVAPYSMLYRFLWNALQRNGVQPGPGLAFGLCCSVPFHNNSWYGLHSSRSGYSDIWREGFRKRTGLLSKCLWWGEMP